MSVSGISSSDSFSYQALQSKMQQFQQEFQQLGQDLQSGNLTQAQSDFATLQSNQPGASTNSQSTSNPIASAFNQLSQDLKSGNLSAAKQDYSTIQQDLLSAKATGGHHHHHHHASASQDSSSSSNSQNPIQQLFSQLGTALQSGNLSTAQSAYASIQQDLSQFDSATSGFSSNASGSAVSVAA